MIDRHSINEEIQAFLDKSASLDEINREFFQKTGIEDFFHSQNQIEEFKKKLYGLKRYGHKSKEFGDFQTPRALTDRICSLIKESGFEPEIIIEPTCGTGNFVISALKMFDSIKYVYAVEIQPEYEWAFKFNILDFSFRKNRTAEIEYHNDNIFTHRISEKLKSLMEDSELNTLIIGNPPWVTNSDLSGLGSDNLPTKYNLKKHRGIDAITGKGNFDIAESTILDMMKKFSYSNAKIAMLCKTSVIRNIVKSMKFLAPEISDVRAYTIDSKKEFNISASSAVLLANLGSMIGTVIAFPYLTSLLAG